MKNLQQGNIAPVDLAQAAIGPGMAVFSRYSEVFEANGEPMRVRTALGIINQMLDEVLSEQESEFDGETRWALTWFEQRQFGEGSYGEAELLATSKALSVSGLAECGIIHSRAGKVRLITRKDLEQGWQPEADLRPTVWMAAQQLVYAIDQGGEEKARDLRQRLGSKAEAARDLAYRLYILCERKGWNEEAGKYNSLVVSWPEISGAPNLFEAARVAVGTNKG